MSPSLETFPGVKVRRYLLNVRIASALLIILYNAAELVPCLLIAADSGVVRRSKPKAGGSSLR